ncbi:hypothetical protein Brsp01_07600 [Brucella sp. NBRC 12950]|nr:hypothetical protein Brsp01_07600 [Brucella sp. NBRC 12950]
MSDRLFDSPVFVKDRPNLTGEIVSIGDALDFLDERSLHDPGLICEAACKACCDAHDCIRPVEAAESAIRGFAKKSGMLEEPEVAIPWTQVKNSAGGRVQA